MRKLCQYCRERVIGHKLDGHLKKCRQRKKYLKTHKEEKPKLSPKIDINTMQEIKTKEVVLKPTVATEVLKPVEIKQPKITKEEKNTTAVKDKKGFMSKMKFLGTKAKKGK